MAKKFSSTFLPASKIFLTAETFQSAIPPLEIFSDPYERRMQIQISTSPEGRLNCFQN